MQSNKHFSDGYLGSLDRLDTTTRRPDAQPSSIDPKALAYADWDSEFFRLYVRFISYVSAVSGGLGSRNHAIDNYNRGGAGMIGAVMGTGFLIIFL